MTRRNKVQSHRHSLDEIRNIMNSMKTLAYMETRKLSRFLDAQHAVVRSIETVAADLLGFHPEILPDTNQATPVYILIGSERGFWATSTALCSRRWIPYCRWILRANQC